MNNNDRWAFVAKHQRLDNLITYLLQSEKGTKLAETLQQDEDSRDY